MVTEAWMMRHTITEFGSGRLSLPMATSTILKRQSKLMRHVGRAKPFHIRFGREDLYGIARDYQGCLRRSRDLLDEHHPAGLLYTVGYADSPVEGNAVHALAKVFNVEVGPKPAQTDGTPAIDMIWAAVFQQFNVKYGIVNLGICADKPGEHSRCNAWDVGVSKPQTAEAIHSAILDIANWLRAKMLEAMGDGAQGLPVGGIIVMEQWCSRESTNWSHYTGEPHVSHVHVSGFPELVPGWI
jgi:hypothetical protein